MHIQQEVLTSVKPVSSEFAALLVGAARLAVLSGVDPIATNVVGCGKFTAHNPSLISPVSL